MGTLIALSAGVVILCYLGLEYTSVFNGMAVKINKLVLVIAMSILLIGLVWMFLSNTGISLRVPISLAVLFFVGFSPFKHELTSMFWNKRYYAVHMFVGFIYVLWLLYYYS